MYSQAFQKVKTKKRHLQVIHQICVFALDTAHPEGLFARPNEHHMRKSKNATVLAIAVNETSSMTNRPNSIFPSQDCSRSMLPRFTTFRCHEGAQSGCFVFDKPLARQGKVLDSVKPKSAKIPSEFAPGGEHPPIGQVPYHERAHATSSSISLPSR